jgi:hypothetical protein
VALPEDVATGLLEAVHGGEHNIDPLIGQQLAPLGYQALPYRHESGTSTVIPLIRGKIANVPHAHGGTDNRLSDTSSSKCD